ncbi:hypothetical protein HAX54_016448 [Datura stramonium]|uniref:Uncharacterized protein n=1 Tax=Datura stramonium TaxID=4076 RepID=A0ABS8UL53_DATST|nr:hypothetical protein [Datura stramonium]
MATANIKRIFFFKGYKNFQVDEISPMVSIEDEIFYMFKAEKMVKFASGLNENGSMCLQVGGLNAPVCACLCISAKQQQQKQKQKPFKQQPELAADLNQTTTTLNFYS